MADFRRVLKALGRGQVDSVSVATGIDRLLRQQPDLADVIIDELDRALAKGSISDTHYDALRECVTSLSHPPYSDDSNILLEAGDDSDDSPVHAGEAIGTHADAADDALNFPPRSEPDDRTEFVDRLTSPPSRPEDLSSPGIQIDVGQSVPSTGAIGSDNAQRDATLSVELIGVGSILRDRYVLESTIGSGGMGVVYRCRDLLEEEAENRNPYVAIKVLKEDFKRHPKAFIALNREANRQARLQHPNIVRVSHFDRDGGAIYMVMELLEGKPLNQLIRERARSRPYGFSFEETWPIIKAFGEALQFAHERKLVHSDFKPGNCFLCTDGTPKVLDFGIARAVPPNSAMLPSTGTAQGKSGGTLLHGVDGDGNPSVFRAEELGAMTVPYASLEMLEGEEPSPSDDVYALALVAYELLTLVHPFKRQSARDARDQGLKPEPIKTLTPRQMRGLARGLAFSRAERSPDVRTFLAEFEGKVPAWRNPWIIAPAASLLLGIPATFIALDYLHDRKIEKVEHALLNAPAGALDGAIDAVAALDETDRRDLVERRIDEIEERFRAHIDELLTQDNFAAARQFLAYAAALRTRWALIDQMTYQIDDRFGKRMDELEVALNACLESADCMARDDTTGYAGLLTSLKALQPDHAKLAANTVSDNFAQRIRAELAAENTDVERAARILANGLRFLPGNPQLAPLEREVASRLEAQASAQAVTELASRVERLLNEGGSNPAVDDLLAAVEALGAREPTHPMLAKAAATLEPAMTGQLSALTGNGDWSALTTLSDRLRPMAGMLGLDEALGRADTARAAFEARMSELNGRLSAAIDAKRLLPGSGTDSALALLASIRAIPGVGSRADEARDLVQSTLLAEARRATRKRSFAGARDLLAAARELGASPAIAIDIERLSEDVTLAERAEQDASAAQAQRERLANAEQAFEEKLKTLQPSRAAIASALSLLEDVESLDANHPLATRGREALGTRVAELAKEAASRDDFDAAFAALEAATKAGLADSAAFQQLRADFNARQQSLLAEQDAEKQNSLRQRVDALLADPRFDTGWRKSLNDTLTEARKTIPASDPWLSKLNERLVTAHVAEVERQVGAKNFAKARETLTAAQELAKSNDTPADNLATLARTIDTAETEWKASRVAADLEERKARVRTLIKAAKFSEARKLVASLQAELPEDDGFFTETGALFADAYLARAQALAQSEPEKALSFAAEGIKYAPESAALSELLGQLRERAIALTVERVAKFTAADGAAIKSQVQVLRNAPGVDYAKVEELLRASANTRLSKWSADDAGCDDARKALGDLFGAADLAACPENAQPPAWLANAGRALDQKRLSETQTLLDAVPPSERSGNYAALLERLATAKTLVDVTLKQVDAAVAQKDPAAAKEALAAAKALWTDRPDPWPIIIDTEPLLPPQPPPVADTCSPAMAGKGVRARAQCRDPLGDGMDGPALVVIPAGDSVGPYAIGRFEVSFDDFSIYCRETSQCAADGGQDGMPVTGVTLDVANGYLEWLSKRTGQRYRLPTPAEWEHAARASGTATDRNFNCRLVVNGTVMKGQGPLKVNSGRPNAWGLFNAVGNVQEWVQGGKVRGGAYEDDLEKCTIDLENDHPGTSDALTGFRVLREMG